MERAHKQGCRKIVGCFQRFPNSEARIINHGHANAAASSGLESIYFPKGDICSNVVLLG